MNSSLLIDHWVGEEIKNLKKLKIKKNIKDFLGLNGNEDSTYPSLWDTMKVLIRGKLMALSASIKKLENSHNRNLRVT